MKRFEDIHSRYVTCTPNMNFNGWFATQAAEQERWDIKREKDRRRGVHKTLDAGRNGFEELIFPYHHVKSRDRPEKREVGGWRGILPFGDGKHFCPGRRLAFVEIVSFVSLVVYGFEVQERGGGVLRHPGFASQPMGDNSKKPRKILRW